MNQSQVWRARGAVALKWALRLAALYFLAAWAGRVVVPTFRRTDTRRDMVLYYRAANDAAAGRSLYKARPDYGPDSKPFEYLYPPPFAALLAPMARLSWRDFALVWTAGLIIAFGAYAAALMRLSGRCDWWSFLIALAAITTTLGAKRALGLGQIDPALWAAAAWGTWAIGRNRGASGAIWGAASLVKIYSFWSLFAARKNEGRKRIWGGALVVGALGLALGALVCGADSYAQWARIVLPEASQGTFDVDNYSLSMAALRAARWAGWNYAGGPLVGLPKLWLGFAAIAGPLGTLWLTRRLALRARVALVTCAAAWCAPLCWTTYVPLILIAVALAVGHWTRDDSLESDAIAENPERGRTVGSI